MAGAIVGGRWTLYDGELPVGAWGSVCAVTGKPPEEGVRFVDIGFTVLNDTPNGDVCLCEEYVAELGAAIGMVPADEHEMVLRRLEEVEGELAFMRQVADAEPRFDEGQSGQGLVLAALERIEAELARRKGGRPTNNKERTNG